jgi:glyoxylase-like metal-dependent hydrolase (beta-lactamase superfamily II)
VTDGGYEVLAVRYGSRRARKSELFHRFELYGEADAEIEMAYYFWVLRAGGRVVLVDTGFDPAVAARRGRECEVAPLEALAALGVAPADVSTVIVTHCHYDHIGNLDAFGDAELVVARRELEFWAGPHARREQFAAHVESDEIDRLLIARDEGRLRLIEGCEEVLPGVSVAEVGGHSPGQLVTVVAGEGGRVVLASDAVHFYEELVLERPFAVVADLGGMYEAYERVGELARAPRTAVVAGHDPSVMERFPPVRSNLGLAVRVDRAELPEPAVPTGS